MQLMQLVTEVDEDTTKITIIFFDAVVEWPNMRLIQKAQHMFLELTAAFARDNLNQGNALINSFLNDTIELRLDLVAFIVNSVQV